LLGVERLELLGDLVALLDVGKLLADFGRADRFVADFGDRIGGSGVTGAGMLGTR
jgi:hypothetical protein